MKRLIGTNLLIVMLFLPSLARAVETDAAVQDLIERIAPGHVKDFVIETIVPPTGENVFEVEGLHGKIVLRGDGPLSQAVAFNWYLKHTAFVDVSWYADDDVKLPAKLALPTKKIRETTKLKDRFFLNYCTFGYTMPFWRWRDWERAIDWMALNGINLPLAQSGNEYIWQKVWREFGLSDEQIRAFFTGPAQLPWNRMANIDKVEGPLPQSYIDGQHDLQKKILARERQLGMSPVLPGFAGHVPEALRAKQPAMKIVPIPPGWAGFSADYATWFLDPLDPKFQEIATRFMREQTKEYGTSHYYGTDPFNEITPPSLEPSYLASVARAIYSGMAQVDPGAIWVQMAWTFTGNRAQLDLSTLTNPNVPVAIHEPWNEARLSALIGAVPQDRMVLIDYECDNHELFRGTKAFYGAPFIWSYLGNFGGNTYLVGPVNKINQRLTAAINDPALAHFAGVGATLEGFNNPVVYEMLFDRVWAGSNMDLSAWIRDEARARSGGSDANVEKAWDILSKKILVDKGDPIGVYGVIFQERNPSLRGEPNTMLSYEIPYNNADLTRAWNLLLRAGPKARESSAYQRDLVDTTRQALGNIGLTLREQMAMAYDRKDAAAFEKSANEFMALGRDIDRFLGTRTEFMLGKWIDDARSWAADKDEQSYYEQNARTILTVWGRGLITDDPDYAGRQWNGLMRDYYLPRWQMLIDATLVELRGGKPVDRAELEKQWHGHNWSFATTAGGSYDVKPSGDYFVKSRALFKKYAPLVKDAPQLSNRQ